APLLIAQHLLAPCEPWKAGKPPRQASSTTNTPAQGMARIVRQEPLPLKPRSDVQPVNGKPSKTLRAIEGSGEFDLIDDPEVKKLTASGKRSKAGSSVTKAVEER